MNRKLSDWASIAEIVSGIAIVATLLILVLEVRGNTGAVEAATYQSMMTELNSWRSMLAENDELALLVERYRYRRADENSESEAIRLRYTLNILWGIYENAYFARGHNVLADQEWSRFEGRICAQYSRDISNGLWAERKIRLVEEFAEHVQALC